MNLIEKLGGYEEAKYILDKAPSWSDTYLKPTKEYVSICIKANDGMHLSLIDIREALLQYRREHNIFEVGDLVTHPIFWGLFEIKKVMNHHIVGVTPTGYESKLAIQLIKHATPEEIKAGKRL